MSIFYINDGITLPTIDPQGRPQRRDTKGIRNCLREALGSFENII
jgi:hypothetical protein